MSELSKGPYEIEAFDGYGYTKFTGVTNSLEDAYDVAHNCVFVENMDTAVITDADGNEEEICR